MVIELRENQDLDELIEQSQKDAVLIFKHSTQCGVSAAAFKELESFCRQNQDVPCGFVRVIENRELSDRIEEQFGIPHDSPQAIAVLKGIPTWNTSHSRITGAALRHAVGR